MKRFLLLVALGCVAAASAKTAKDVEYTCSRFEPGTVFRYACWAPDGLKDGEGAVYVFLERGLEGSVKALEPLMKDGTIPPGICVFTWPGSIPAPAGGGASRFMRAEEYDQPGTEFPSALADEIVPDAERVLGVKASRDPNLHFVTGCSSGGIAAWNACWYRNDFFRRAFCSSPTFSNIRQGNQLMPLVRKCETRPIRAWMSVGTDEPDYFFGDSYFVAEDAAGAIRFAGYELRFDRFEHEGHGAHYGDNAYLGKVVAWLFADWKTKPVAVTANPVRVRDVVVKGTTWEACAERMPAPVREVRSTDGWRVYSVNPTNRFVMSERVNADGTRDQRVRLAPLELAWNVSQPGGKALAHAADDRVYVATELGVQGVVPFGIADVVLPLPGDLPCDNVALVGTNLFASSGGKVFRRPVQVGAADPAVVAKPTAPGYGDGFWYSREHAPAGGMREMLGSYVMAGRISGVISVLSDGDYNETWDCVGWAQHYGARGRGEMRPDTMFAIFSMSKTFMGAAMMCAIDEGKISLDDPVSKYLPEFADVKMKDGSRPKRPVTVRDITSHVSGFRGGYDLVNRDIPMREVARLLAATPLHTQPGEKFAYCTATIDSAGACIEVAVGKPFEVYLREKILDPLGMKDTTFSPNEEQVRRLVAAYASKDEKLRPAADRCAAQLVFPKAKPLCPGIGAGLFSTAQDMIRFSQMLAHHGEWKGKTIISRKTFDGIFAVKQTPPGIPNSYTCGSWIYGDWFGHEGAMRTDQRANLRTGHSRVFFIQTENRAGSAFFQLKRDWHCEADKIQGTPAAVFGN